VTPVEDVTGVPAILATRVVTLHPKIHGGILAERDDPTHQADMATYGSGPIDLVIANLYPFAAEPGIETIDIGGPAMVRAAAKNHRWVAVVTRPEQYEPLLEELRAHGATLGDDTRRRLAVDAFAATAAFDAAIVEWMQGDEVLPDHIVLGLERRRSHCASAENPLQAGAAIAPRRGRAGGDAVVQHGGLALSYLNLYDTDAPGAGARPRRRPAVAFIKHANRRGVAMASDLADAYQRALECDERSAFGGIVALTALRRGDGRADGGPVRRPTCVIGRPTGPARSTPCGPSARTPGSSRRPRPGPLARDLPADIGRVPGPGAHGYAAGRDQWRVVTKAAPTEAAVGRRRARLAPRRPREVETPSCW